MKRLALLLIALPAFAQDAPAPDLRVQVMCTTTGLCVVHRQLLTDMTDAHNAQIAEITKLEKRVKELESGAPKCATLEVVPKVPIDPKTNRPS